MFDVILREETLLNVVKSVTRNGRSILLTAVLALVLVYMFSIVGFLFFQDDFEIEVENPLATIGMYQHLIVRNVFVLHFLSSDHHNSVALGIFYKTT